MPVDKYTRITLVTLIAMYVACAFLQLVDYLVPTLPVHLSLIAFLGFSGICITVLFYVQKDIIYRFSRNHLLGALGLLLAWQITDMIRSLTPFLGEKAHRILWYSTYTPICFIPTLILLGIAYYEIPQDRRLPRHWFVFYLISGALALLTLSNDYHGWAFLIGDSHLHLVDHGHGPVYYLIVVWTCFQCAFCAILIRRRAKLDRVKGKRTYIYITMILVAVYFIWHMTGQQVVPWLANMISTADFVLAATILPVEIAIRRGHIRSNFNYPEVFEACTVSILVEDQEGTIRYKTEKEETIPKEMRKAARIRDYALDENHRLISRPITGGRVYWVEDLTPINEITESLKETRQELTQENELIRAENEMRARAAQADEQNRLYGMLIKEAAPQLRKTEELIRDLEPDDPRLREKLAEACIYKAFAKRYCNMRLQAQEDQELSLFELKRAFTESSEYLALSGIRTDISLSGDGRYPADFLIRIYKIFEYGLEMTLPELFCVRISGEAKADELRITIWYLLKESGSLFEADAIPRAILETRDDFRTYNGDLEAEWDDSDLKVVLFGRREADHAD